MIRKIISGGQTGVDQAALRAAVAAGISTGGTMPKGWITENGPMPEFAAMYGMVECRQLGYPSRTEANVRNSDGTLLLCWGIIGYGSRGSQLTKTVAAAAGKPFMVIDLQREHGRAQDVADWIRTDGIQVLNVAGNRESGKPGIGEQAEKFIGEVLSLLKEAPHVP